MSEPFRVVIPARYGSSRLPAKALREIAGAPLVVHAWRRAVESGAEEVLALGDMPNDIAMLTWAGTSYAMANAHPTVRAAAQHVAPANDDDGVAHVIESLLDSRVGPWQD